MTILKKDVNKMITSNSILNDIKLPPCKRCGNTDAEIICSDTIPRTYSIFCEECHLCIIEKSILKTLELWEKGVEMDDQKRILL